MHPARIPVGLLLLVVICIGLGAGGLELSRITDAKPWMSSVVLQEAREFSHAQGFDPTRVSCTDIDTRSHAPVRCTVSQMLHDELARTVEFECYPAFSLNWGCHPRENKFREEK